MAKMNYEEALASGRHDFRYTEKGEWVNRGRVTRYDLESLAKFYRDEQFLPIPTAEELLSEVECVAFREVSTVLVQLDADGFQQGDIVRVRKVKG